MIALTLLAEQARLLLDHETGLTPAVVEFLQRVIDGHDEFYRLQAVIDAWVDGEQEP